MRIFASEISPQFESIFLSLLENCMKNESVNRPQNGDLFCSFDFRFRQRKQSTLSHSSSLVPPMKGNHKKATVRSLRRVNSGFQSNYLETSSLPDSSEVIPTDALVFMSCACFFQH